MTHQEDIAALERRLAKAESDRNASKVAGPPEKYLEAYFTVQALWSSSSSSGSDQRAASRSW